MKKVLIIIIAGILFASGMVVSIDRHYCGGNLADIKISFTGKMATCGMEQGNPVCPDHPVIGNKCCEDQVTYYCLSSNYFPEYFDITRPNPVRSIMASDFNNFNVNVLLHSELISWVVPPGYNILSRLTQQDICVFRI